MRTHFDNSTLKTFNECLLKGVFRMEKHLVSDGAIKPLALEFGSWYHSALDTLFVTMDVQKAIEKFMSGYQDIFDSYPYEDKNRTPERAVDLLMGYWKYYESDFYQMKMVKAEETFCFPICQCPVTGEQLFFVGKIDKQFEVDNKIRGMDHKTASRLYDTDIQAAKISRQFLGYCYNILRTHGEEKIDWLFYVDFSVTGRKVDQSQMHLSFIREPIYCEKPMLDLWFRQTVGQIEFIRTWLHEGHQLWQNTDACKNYARLCPYFSICSQPRELWDSVIAMTYREEEWNPLLEEI